MDIIEVKARIIVLMPSVHKLVEVDMGVGVKGNFPFTFVGHGNVVEFTNKKKQLSSVPQRS